ncbi:APC family permease [Sphingomonas segetis]|jgi:APA family basic amino acid/polyamine antiporter|uniref:APC family permease n=1 Tax=Sphingomonas segetis TaxID=1104779 RepID=UPI0012D363E9|nr:APC family permease [Sphingomonas segetis]
MADDREARLLGPWMTLALVIGGVIGSGIFYLPIALAPLGGSVPIGWLISGVGIMAMAYCASRIVSRDGGGLQAYVEHELGPGVGFIVTWMTWCSSWVGVPAVALAASAALATVFPSLAGHLVILAFAFTAVFALINLRGIRATGEVAIVTVLIKVLPLLAVIAIAAMLGTSGGPVHPIDVPPPTFGNIATASALCLFALTGFEFAMSPVGKIRNPERNLARALLFGLAGIALLYLLVTTSLSLVMPNAAIAKSIAPFPDAIGLYWGGTAALLAALAMAISALGTLNAALLACGEMLYSMSLRRDMPAIFDKTNRFNAPYMAQFAAVILGFILLALNEAKGTTQLFTFITLLATDAVLYLYSAAAIAAAFKDRRPSTTIACAIGLAFVLYAFYGSGVEAFLLSLALLAIGGLIYWLRKGRTIPPPEASPA